ncbi:hypothetical protein FA13DRAFT_1726643 [Coprinellus micaceus]|jgi:hypothetical protein|uniref:Uncharacterized protein n=1 Tax=Coprinellus micaceus TaxID=71717 RepID=A0A4Y7TTN2_COPMI|nr:hypothetical protein FA13DRAFT_1726643 [Coprinellus micaceus]
MDQLNVYIEYGLEYLQGKLPPPFYSILITGLSYLLALCTAAARLIGSLASTHPQDWDAQTVLPPIITLLAAYLALLSLYRTATWALKLAIWFIKWGAIIGILAMGAGWLAAVSSMNKDGGTSLAGIASNLMDGRSGNGNPKSKSNVRISSNDNPRAGNFQATPNWQYQEGADKQQNEVQNVMQNIADTAQQILDGSAWWELGKIVAGAQKPAEAREERNKDRSKPR